jgi:hypothetical protein
MWCTSSECRRCRILSYVAAPTIVSLVIMAQSIFFTKPECLSITNYKKYIIQNWSPKNYHTFVPLRLQLLLKSTILLHGVDPASQHIRGSSTLDWYLNSSRLFFLRLLIIPTIHTLQLDSAHRFTSQGEFCHANSYLHSNKPARQ